MSRNDRIALFLGCAFGLVVFWTVVYDYLFNPGCCSKESAARIGVSDIEHAVVTYKNAHGDYPPSLKELIVPESGKPALLDVLDLNDPWGRAFRYDTSQCHPQTGRPKIFTVSPDGQTISNW